ncbi:hypothetical protein ACE6H2_013286 [Prunus campanulata]
MPSCCVQETIQAGLLVNTCKMQGCYGKSTSGDKETKKKLQEMELEIEQNKAPTRPDFGDGQRGGGE